MEGQKGARKGHEPRDKSLIIRRREGSEKPTKRSEAEWFVSKEMTGGSLELRGAVEREWP